MKHDQIGYVMAVEVEVEVIFGVSVCLKNGDTRDEVCSRKSKHNTLGIVAYIRHINKAQHV